LFVNERKDIKLDLELEQNQDHLQKRKVELLLLAMRIDWSTLYQILYYVLLPLLNCSIELMFLFYFILIGSESERKESAGARKGSE